VDEETQRLIAIRRIKQARLHELDKQAAAMGEYAVPPHIQMERNDLRRDLGLAQLELSAVETAIAAPITSNVGDELGPNGRFMVYYQQNREIKQSIAKLADDFDEFKNGRFQDFVSESKDWRMRNRQWLLIIGVAVVIILVIIVAYVAFQAGQGRL
jgi:preprotein translocase subunit SecF